MVTRIAAGVDIGGTSIKLGLVDGGGAVLARRRVPYAGLASFEHLVDAIGGAIGAMAGETGSAVDAVGIAAPGFARPADGRMIDGTANVPLLRDRSLVAALGAGLGLPTAQINDGSAATLGELRFGAGRGLRRFALLTLGTGVGGGVVIDGRLVTGEGGVPPELGAIVLADADDGPRTLEQFASAGGFAEAYRRQGGQPGCTPQEILRRASAGEPIACGAVDAVARRMAQAFGMLVNALNLQACVIGGGIGQAGAPILDRVRDQLPAFTWPFLVRSVRVVGAATGEDAGVLGAAAQVLA